MTSLFRKSKCNDEEIIRLISLDDRSFAQAYKCIQKNYFPTLRGFLINEGIYRKVEQSDMITDAILIFRRKIIEGNFIKTDAKIGAYLAAIIKNLIRNHRKNKKFETLEVDEDYFRGGIVKDKNQEQTMSHIFELIGQLSVFCQELLIAFYLHNMSLEGFAKKKGMSAVAVRKSKERCIKKLRSNI